MDAHRFDALAKALATATSRRQALRVLTGGAIVGALAHFGSGGGTRALDADPTSPPIVPVGGAETASAPAATPAAETSGAAEASGASGASAPPAASGMEIDYYALGDSIASGHGLGDDDGPDPDMAPSWIHSCRDCESDKCKACEASPGCQTCVAPQPQCSNQPCDSRLQCQSCCRRSSRSYPYRVRDHLKTVFPSVQFPATHHLACTGPTSLSPITLAEDQLDFVSPVPTQDLVLKERRTRLKLLRNQIDDALQLLQNRPPGRRALVSITIGANDFQFSDVFALLRRLYSLPWLELVGEKFNDWATKRSKQVGAEVADQVGRLLQQPNVYVVITEVHNPFNPKSVFFLGADALSPLVSQMEMNPLNAELLPALLLLQQVLKQAHCGLVDCYPRTIAAAKLLNDTLSGVVQSLNKTWPGRVGLARILDAFDAHKSPRPSCGAAPPDDQPSGGNPGTWIQYREDKRSISYSVPRYWDLAHIYLGDWRGDCFHPNDDGAQYIADTIYQVARKILGPKINNPTAKNLTQTGATITWTTDQLADSAVEYGPSWPQLGQSAADCTQTTDHSITLTGLTPGTTYHYRVRSKISAGLEDVTTQDRTFTTLATPVTGHVQIAVLDCSRVEQTPAVTTTFNFVSPTAQIDAPCDTVAAYAFTITGSNGQTVHVTPGGPSAFDLPVGSYTISEDATGVSAPFDVPSDGLRILAFVAGSAATATGSVTLDFALCPPGMTPQTLGQSACTPIGHDAFQDLTIAGPVNAANPLQFGLADATSQNGGFTWANLPLGDYNLQPGGSLASGYSLFYIPTLPLYACSGVATSTCSVTPPGPDTAMPGHIADTGYRLTLTADQPDLTLDVFVFQAANAACPNGQTSCNGAYVDTASDAANCDGCGNACPPGQACVGSQCQAASGIVMPSAGYVLVTSMGTNGAICDAAFGIQSPVSQTIFASTHDPNNQTVTLGPFNAGDQLVFWFTPQAGSICTTETYLSTDPNHADISSQQPGSWVIGWEDLDPGQPGADDFQDFVVGVALETAVTPGTPEATAPLTSASCPSGQTSCQGACVDTVSRYQGSFSCSSDADCCDTEACISFPQSDGSAADLCRWKCQTAADCQAIVPDGVTQCTDFSVANGGTHFPVAFCGTAE